MITIPFSPSRKVCVVRNIVRPCLRVRGAYGCYLVAVVMVGGCITLRLSSPWSKFPRLPLRPVALDNDEPLRTRVRWSSIKLVISSLSIWKQYNIYITWIISQIWKHSLKESKITAYYLNNKYALPSLHYGLDAWKKQTGEYIVDWFYFISRK